MEIFRGLPLNIAGKLRLDPRATAGTAAFGAATGATQEYLRQRKEIVDGLEIEVSSDNHENIFLNVVRATIVREKVIALSIDKRAVAREAAKSAASTTIGSIVNVKGFITRRFSGS